MSAITPAPEHRATAFGADVLHVEDLRVEYVTSAGIATAVDGVSFTVRAGERLGLVGESGSGKSTIATALMRLLRPPARVAGGRIVVDGVELQGLSDEAMRRMRLATIALVAQGAINSLNPSARVEDQILDGLVDHGRAGRREQRRRVAEVLRQVGLRPEVARLFPHQLSGGMRQRVCIAIAISLRPKVLVADEPTSALDVVVQHQVMETFRAVQDDLGAAMILIGHDIGLMAQFATRVGIMYAGLLAEIGETRKIFGNPLHPYTRLLIASITTMERKTELKGIPGLPPSLIDRPTGCPFRDRCPFAMERCAVEEPLPRPVDDRLVACHLY